MKKCNFLNPNKYEFLVWFFLGIALTIDLFLIVFVMPISKEYTEILKDGIGAFTTIIVAIPSVILILCQMKQTEEVQKQTNTLQLIDSLLYKHFKEIFKKIEDIELETATKIVQLQQQIPNSIQFDNRATPDTEPNEKYFEYEGKRLEIDTESQQKTNYVLEEFFEFIFDMEVKIEQKIINEELVKLYFKKPILELFTKKFIINMLQFSGYKTKDNYDNDKKKKIIDLSKRWYDYNYLEFDKKVEQN